MIKNIIIVDFVYFLLVNWYPMNQKNQIDLNLMNFYFDKPKLKLFRKRRGKKGEEKSIQFVGTVLNGWNRNEWNAIFSLAIRQKRFSIGSICGSVSIGSPSSSISLCSVSNSSFENRVTKTSSVKTSQFSSHKTRYENLNKRMAIAIVQVIDHQSAGW